MLKRRIPMNLFDYEPKASFSQKHLLTLQDWSEDEIYQCLSLALKLKAMQKSGQRQTCLSGKTLAMIFAKSSTRTRVSFEVGATQLGGSALFLSTSDIQLGRGEPISDTAQVLSSEYADNGIQIDAVLDETLYGRLRQYVIEEL